MDLAQINRQANGGAAARSAISRAGSTPMGYRLWSQDDDKVFRTLFPDYERLKQAFPHRSQHALYSRAAALGIAKPYHRWTSREVSRLRRLYPAATNAELEAGFPGIPLNVIRITAERYRFKRNPRKYVRCGYPPMDAVLARLEEIGWSLSDLDEACGLRYFKRSHRWRTTGVKLHALAKAINVLGGEITVTWRY